MEVQTLIDRENAEKDQEFWSNVLWTDEPKRIILIPKQRKCQKCNSTKISHCDTKKVEVVMVC